MDGVILLKQAFLFGHLIAFAIALGEVLRADVRLVFGCGPDTAALNRSALIVTLGLAALWATGLCLVYFDIGFDLTALAQKPKLLTKLLVVTALTANGALLHEFAFPALNGAVAATRPRAILCAVLGAVSSVSWLYAAFVGAARLIAPQITLTLFLAVYGAALGAGIAVSVVVIAPMIERRGNLRQPIEATASPITPEDADEEHPLAHVGPAVSGDDSRLHRRAA